MLKPPYQTELTPNQTLEFNLVEGGHVLTAIKSAVEFVQANQCTIDLHIGKYLMCIDHDSTADALYEDYQYYLEDKQTVLS